MAAMNYEMARAAAEKLIQAGRANGLTREALISQIIAGAPAAGGVPQGAIASALMPPVEATPATPVREGVPFVAPKPVASAQPRAEAMPAQEAEPQPAAATPRPSEFRPMLESTLAEIVASEGAMSQAAANNQPVNIIEQARLRGLKERARQLQDRVAAQEGAEVPEEMRAALKGRQERLSRREELLQESKARSPWQALLAGGAEMVQGRRGESAGAALARGLQVGFQDYERSRRENVAGVESVGEARDQVVMDRYNALEKARAAAVALVNSGQDVDERTLRLANLTSEGALKAALAPFAVRKGSAEAQSAEFEAKTAPEKLAMEKALNVARINEANKRDKPTVDVELRADRDVIDKLAADYEAKRSLFNEALSANKMNLKLVPPELRADLTAAEARLRTQSSAFERIHGKSPYITTQRKAGAQGGNKPPVAGARLAPDGKYYVPDPKRPGKYLQVG